MDTEPKSQPNVSIGPTSIAGITTTITGVVMAIIAVYHGDETQATISAIVGGTLAIVSAAITYIGRYVQANSQIKAAAQVRAAQASAAPPVTGGAQGAASSNGAGATALVIELTDDEAELAKAPQLATAATPDVPTPAPGAEPQVNGGAATPPTPPSPS